MLLETASDEDTEEDPAPSSSKKRAKKKTSPAKSPPADYVPTARTQTRVRIVVLATPDPSPHPRLSILVAAARSWSSPQPECPPQLNREVVATLHLPPVHPPSRTSARWSFIVVAGVPLHASAPRTPRPRRQGSLGPSLPQRSRPTRTPPKISRRCFVELQCLEVAFARL